MKLLDNRVPKARTAFLLKKVAGKKSSSHVYLRALLLIGLVSFTCQTQAFAQQQQPLSFHFYRIKAGLPQHSATAIFQGPHGFMWIGTADGLVRYDGYETRVYRSIPFDTTSLMGNSVTSLLIDHTGTLWVGTGPGGLNRFDRATQTFRHYRLGSQGNYIFSLYEDSKGYLWIGTKNGLWKMNPERTKIQRVKVNPSINKPMFVGMIKQTKNGLLIITSYGLYLKKQGSLSFTHLRLNISTTVTSVEAGNRAGILWLGTRQGLLHLNFDNGKHHYFNYIPISALQTGWRMLPKTLLTRPCFG